MKMKNISKNIHKAKKSCSFQLVMAIKQQNNKLRRRKSISKLSFCG